MILVSKYEIKKAYVFILWVDTELYQNWNWKWLLVINFVSYKNSIIYRLLYSIIIL